MLLTKQLRRRQKLVGPQPEYAEAAAYIADEMLAPGAADLAVAEAQRAAGMPGPKVETAYRSAHDGYIRVCWALSITAAPQLVS